MDAEGIAEQIVEITLYVRGNELASVRAREAMQGVVAGLPTDGCTLRVCDIEDPECALEAAESGVFTAPLLRLRVVRSGRAGPASWVASVTTDYVRARIEQLLEATAGQPQF